MIENLNIGKVSEKLNKIASGTAVLNMKSIPTKITFHQGIANILHENSAGGWEYLDIKG